MIEASVVLDSINPHGSRLVTMLARYPKWIHGEHLRHRSFSFSVSSSRAIPVSRNLEEVRSDELRAAPVYWGAEQKGMSAGEELTHAPRILVEREWQEAAIRAADAAERMVGWGAHKSIVNRVLEPFLHVNVLVTGTTDGWLNFFGLRLDKAAQPEIRALAEAQWKLWNDHTPSLLKPGEWHLPFAGPGSLDSVEYFHDTLRDAAARCAALGRTGDGQLLEMMKRISTARCARLSYRSFETGRRSTIEEDLALYDRLITSRPIHASPAEHQATPDEKLDYVWLRNVVGVNIAAPKTLPAFRNEKKAGNLDPGWIQYRKTLPGEAVAELPEGYR